MLVPVFTRANVVVLKVLGLPGVPIWAATVALFVASVEVLTWLLITRMPTRKREFKYFVSGVAVPENEVATNCVGRLPTLSAPPMIPVVPVGPVYNLPVSSISESRPFGNVSV